MAGGSQYIPEAFIDEFGNIIAVGIDRYLVQRKQIARDQELGQKRQIKI